MLLSPYINDSFIITTVIYIIFHQIIFNKLKTDISSTKITPQELTITVRHIQFKVRVKVHTILMQNSRMHLEKVTCLSIPTMNY